MFNFQRNALLGKISAEPLCAQYKTAWRTCGDDKDALVRLVLKQQAIPYFNHACYHGVGLSKSYVLSAFSEYINGKKTYEDIEGVSGYTYQIYADYNEQLLVSADVTSIMWSNSLEAVIPKTKCPRIYVSNSSDVHITLDGYNSPAIYLFDNSKVTIEDGDEESQVLVYKYSKEATVELGKYCFANVRVFDKKLKL